MKVGLVGFPGSGKTSAFFALTGQQGALGHSGKGPGKTHFAAVPVTEPSAARIIRPRKQVLFVDVAAPPGIAGRSFDAQVMVAMREVDTLLQVVRGFASTDGSPADPVGELTDLATEMRVGDLATIDKRLARLHKEAPKPDELTLLKRLRAELEHGTPLREVTLSATEQALIAGQQFLTQKPLVVLYNVAESDPPSALPSDLTAYAARHTIPVVPLCSQRSDALTAHDLIPLWQAIKVCSSVGH